MNDRICLLLIMISLSLNMIGQTYEESPSDFFFSDAADEMSILMAPSFISTGMSETFATISHSGDEFYCCIKSGFDQSVIVGIRFEDGFWTFPEVLSFSGEYTDLSPFVTPDGQYLYFVSDRPRNDSTEIKNFNIWRCPRKTDNSWGAPELIGFSSDSGNELSVSVDRAGNVYFSADYERQGLSLDPNVQDIYWVKKEADGAWGPIQKLGGEINTDAIEQTPAISPDGKTLVFSSMRSGGKGSADLYVSFFQDGQWSPAVNLGEGINTGAYEWCPAFSGDGKWLLFSSNLKNPRPEKVDYRNLKKWLLGHGNGAFDIRYIKAAAINHRLGHEK
ncbi:TolB family protein [Thermophagus xiamenensis]|uniref:WD40-like Beta Propeller Repeat n=1 Tax=Thermophagus xiamenensis TaxID=385682 RepID=A0A1I1UG19_9BACT|nr:PD40 domain-containing protein [Thermophagus xiamenensis]SFD69786.1 WD40-like Beta Propeller Repeat [Thermophagus xiamenensis]